MDMNAQNQYLDDIKKEYIQAKKQRKSVLLDEVAKRTGLCRKHLIIKLSAETDLRPQKRKPRACYYDSTLIILLAKIWEIFDCPCGQRLAPLIHTELDRLRTLREINCTDDQALKLKKISPSVIDTKLRHERDARHLSRHRKSNPLLFQQFPIKVNNELNHDVPGHCQVDYVEHGGQSCAGEYAHTIATVDLFSDWWDAVAIMPKSQSQTHTALDEIKKRSPFIIKELHPDNDRSILNELIARWAQKHRIELSRSRPYKKNDNAHIEQKNRTHVRNMIGYRRYDTRKELIIINELYALLRLYKNFFQPIMRLADKRRNGGKVHRTYNKPVTPYKRLLESAAISEEQKTLLIRTYHKLNPADLKRRINLKTMELYNAYELKINKISVPSIKKLKPHMVRNYIIQRPNTELVSVR
jgi:hypothetical protein